MLEIQQIHISALQRLKNRILFCIASLNMLQLLCKEKWKFTNQMSYAPNSRPLRGQEAKQTCSLPCHLQANELPYAERTQRKTNVQAHSRVLCVHSLTTVSHSEVHSETTWQHRDAKVSRGYGKFRKSLNEICSCSKNVLWVKSDNSRSQVCQSPHNLSLVHFYMHHISCQKAQWYVHVNYIIRTSCFALWNDSGWASY